MNEVVIVSAVRTPIGRIRGALSQVRLDDLAALVLRVAVERAGIDPASIEEVYLGCANQAGEDNRNVARMALLLAGLPQQIGGVTINRPPRDGHMAFVRSPDGISIELLQKGAALPPKEPWTSMPNTGSW